MNRCSTLCRPLTCSHGFEVRCLTLLHPRATLARRHLVSLVDFGFKEKLVWKGCDMQNIHIYTYLDIEQARLSQYPSLRHYVVPRSLLPTCRSSDNPHLHTLMKNSTIPSRPYPLSPSPSPSPSSGIQKPTITPSLHSPTPSNEHSVISARRNRSIGNNSRSSCNPSSTRTSRLVVARGTFKMSLHPLPDLTRTTTSNNNDNNNNNNKLSPR
jgi:hypothetical protein